MQQLSAVHNSSSELRLVDSAPWWAMSATAPFQKRCICPVAILARDCPCSSASGYPGGLKEITAKELWRRDPTEILRRTVYGMLPKNNLREARMRKLRIFPGPQHPFAGVELMPWEMPPRKLQEKGLGWLIPQGFEPVNPQAYAQRIRGSRLLVQQPQQQDLLQRQEEEQQQQQQDSTAAGVQAAGALTGTLISFDDLLTAEELALVQSRDKQRS